MTNMNLFLLILNFGIALAFGIFYFVPKFRPTADRFFRFFAWGWIATGILFMTGCAFTPNSAVQMISSVIIPMIEGIIPIAAAAASVLLPAESGLITEASTLTTSGLQALKKLIDQYEANPNDTTLAAVNNALNAVHDNLAQLMAAAQVKDAKTAMKLTWIVTAAVQSLATIESLLAAKHPQTVAAAKAAQTS